MPSFKRVCPVCGSHEIADANGDFFCLSCDTLFANPFKDNKKIKEEEIKKITAFERAEELLHLSPPRFMEAEERFDNLIKEYPDSAQAYWGKIRSKYGIKYEYDVGNKVIPTCYLDKYYDIAKDPLFKKCIDHAPSQELAEKYISEANKINVTMREWEVKASKYHYDIFLSFKASEENGNETIDSKVMRELYTYFTSKGLKVFYSPVSMREHTGKPYYDAYIFNALDKSQVLIVYGSNPAYFSSTWIENEWSRYLTQIARKQKQEDSLIVVYKGFNPSIELPSKIAHRQNYDGSSYTLFPDLLKYVSNILEKTKVNKKEKKKILNHISINPLTKPKYEPKPNDLEEISDNHVEKKITQPQDVKIKKLNYRKDVSHSSLGLEGQYQSAEACLKIKNYEDASHIFNNIIASNNSDPLALVGFVACKVKHADLYFGVKAKKEAIFNDRIEMYIPLNVGKYLNYLAKALDNVEDIKQAESILSYLHRYNKKLIISVNTHDRHAKKKLELYDFVNSYDTKVRIEQRKTFIDSLNDWLISLSPKVVTKIYNHVLNSFSEEERVEYLNTYELLINAYIKKRNPKMVKYWNKRKLEYAPGDLKAYTRNLYLAFKVGDRDTFIDLNKHRKIAKKVVKLIEKDRKNLSKDTLFYLFDVLQDSVYITIKTRYNNTYKKHNRLCYLEYLARFNYPHRNNFFLNIADNYLDELESYHDIKSILLVAKACKAFKVDVALDKLEFIAAGLRDKCYFKEAKKAANIGLEIAPNDGRMLYQILLADMKYDGEFKEQINPRSFTQNRIEHILKYSSQKEQSRIITELSDIFDNAIDKCVGKRRFTRLADAYDILIMYISLSDSELSDIATRIAYASCRNGEFSYALKYGLILQDKFPNDIDALVIFLLYRLRCRTEEEIPYSFRFKRNLLEYRELIEACRNNPTLLSKYSNYASEHDRNKLPFRKLSKKHSVRRHYFSNYWYNFTYRLSKFKDKIVRVKKFKISIHVDPYILKGLGSVLIWALVFLGLIAAIVCTFIFGGALWGMVVLFPTLVLIMVLIGVVIALYFG